MKLKPVHIFLFIVLCVAAAVLISLLRKDSEATAGINQCTPIKEGLTNNLSGWLVYESRNENKESFAFDLGTKTTLQLDHLTVDTLIGPSKAGLLTYYDYAQNAWVVADLTRQTQGSVLNIEQATPIAWIGERLLIGSDRLQLFDPSSGKADDLIPDVEFPKIDNEMDWSAKLNWGGYSPFRIVPSPDLSRLAFVASGEPAVSLLVWDRQNARALAQLHWVDTQTAPQWSPDGSGVLSSAPPSISYQQKLYINVTDHLPYVGGNDLMYAGVDGSIRRLTTFSSFARAVESRYVWSPDGSQIASVVDFMVNGADIQRVAVIAFTTEGVTTFCLPSATAEVSGFPVWSPDGRTIALAIRDGDAPLQTYAVDVGSGAALRLDSDAQIVGWWRSP